MKKYVTTKKNICFKEGISVLEGGGTNPILANYDHQEKHVNLSEYQFEAWLKSDYIEEVEEKEFTRSELKDIVLGLFGLINI